MAFSSRVLRKIRGDDTILSPKDNEDSDGDDTILQTPPQINSNINRYCLLNGSSESEPDVKEGDDGTSPSQIESQDQTNRVKKKKKKKKKQKPKVKTQKQVDDDEDEVERSVREVNAILGDIPSAPVINKDEVVEEGSPLLAIEKKYLNPKNELKKMFGADAVQSVKEAPPKRNQRCRMKRLNLVPHILPPQEFDPPQSMRLISEKNGVLYFKYEHDAHYQSVERKLRDGLQTADPGQLIVVGGRYPLHVNTLLQLSETFAVNDEVNTACKFIERALYALEIAFHPSFNIFKGNCRLEYKYQENRALFIALFKYMIYLGEKACYRTALELAKLIYSLNPVEDHMAIGMILDFYAIRAGEYKWLIDFLDEFGPKKKLLLLPNMAYSYALAHFLSGQKRLSDGLLQIALMTFPAVLIPLMEKCHVVLDEKTLGSPFFRLKSKDPLAYRKLTELYVKRSYYLWKEPSIIAWLEKNARYILEQFEQKDQTLLSLSVKKNQLFSNRIPTVCRRHAFLSGLEPHYHLYFFDPMPPADGVNLYPNPMESVNEMQSMLSLLFRSMQPSFTPPPALPSDEHLGEEQQQQQQQDAAAGGIPLPLQESVGDLRRAVSSLLRNLLRSDQENDPESDD